MRTFGLIGYPLSHSFSKRFFSEKFERENISHCSYELFPMEEVNGLMDLIRNTDTLVGFNVTIPHKLNIIPYLNHLDEAAAAIGAVNCVRINREHGEVHLSGFNTDAFGFAESIKPLLEPWHKKALIFGDGGAAKAVKFVLNELGIPFLVVSRKNSSISIGYDDVNSQLLAENQILINTTPLGMMPNVDKAPPIPYNLLSDKHLAYDLVYNPLETLFLRNSQQFGAKVKNGLEMLHLQAERSWEIWND